MLYLLTGRSLLSISELAAEEIEEVLLRADTFMEVLGRKVKKVPALRGKTIANIFFEPSTRTKSSFETAAKRLSADIIGFSASHSSLKKGESIIDTIKTILAMKVNLLVIRHGYSGVLNFISQKTDIPIINAGDGKRQHPTQALLDLYTIRKRFRELQGLKVAIVGDYLNSRVARSNIELFTKMGINVTVAAPSMLLPADESVIGVKTVSTIDEIIEDMDIIYMLRMQFERQDKKFYPSIWEYNRFIGLDVDRVKRMKKGCVIMHPGPVNRGIELRDEVMNGAVRSDDILISEQVTHGVAIRMALLYLILSQQEES